MGEDDFKMVLEEIVYEGANWIHLVQNKDQCEQSNEAHLP
jgi:hypothetical protein